MEWGGVRTAATVRRALQASPWHISNPPYCQSQIYPVFQHCPPHSFTASPSSLYPPIPLPLPSFFISLIIPPPITMPIDLSILSYLLYKTVWNMLSVSLSPPPLIQYLCLSPSLWNPCTPAVRNSPLWRADLHVRWPTIKYQSLYAIE